MKHWDNMPYNTAGLGGMGLAVSTHPLREPHPSHFISLALYRGTSHVQVLFLDLTYGLMVVHCTCCILILATLSFFLPPEFLLVSILAFDDLCCDNSCRHHLPELNCHLTYHLSTTPGWLCFPRPNPIIGLWCSVEYVSFRTWFAHPSIYAPHLKTHHLL